MLKKSLYTIINVVVINAILFLAHIIAIFGLAFNDSGAEFPSVLHLLPNMFFCIGPLAVGSFFLIRVFAMLMECYKPVLYVVQGLLVVCYIVTYINEYVPTSMVRKAGDFMAEKRIEREQEKRDKTALHYLDDKYVEVYDEIENSGESITIYICHDSEKVVFRYCNDITEQVAYYATDAEYMEGPETDSLEEYRNLETGYTVLRYHSALVYLGIGENYYVRVDTRDLKVYYGKRTYTDIGSLYFELLNRDVIENNFRYLPYDIAVLEIEENDMVFRITEESLRQLSIPEDERRFSYGWTILRNGQEVLSRGIYTGEYTLNLRELSEDIWKPAGTYEVYLHTFFHSNRYGEEYSGYIKASNSVFWDMPAE